MYSTPWRSRTAMTRAMSSGGGSAGVGVAFRFDLGQPLEHGLLGVQAATIGRNRHVVGRGRPCAVQSCLQLLERHRQPLAGHGERLPLARRLRLVQHGGGGRARRRCPSSIRLPTPSNSTSSASAACSWSVTHSCLQGCARNTARITVTGQGIDSIAAGDSLTTVGQWWPPEREVKLLHAWRALRATWRHRQLVLGVVRAERSFGVFIDAGVAFPVLIDLADPVLRIGDRASGVIDRFDAHFMEVVLTDAAEDVATSTGTAVVTDDFSGNPPEWNPRLDP